MTKSLRNWLASLFMLASPGVAFGQNYVGQPYLAPVALEARCRVADGMLDSWPNFRGIGADPIHLAMQANEGLAGDKITKASKSNIAGADNVPADNVPRKTRTSYQLGADFCPMADFVLHLGDELPEQVVSLEDTQPSTDAAAVPVATSALMNQIAACEPVDVEPCGEDYSYCDYLYLQSLEDESTCVAEVEAVEFSAPIEELAATEVVSDSVADSIVEEKTLAAEEHHPVKPAESRFAGSSPVIFSLQEEYYPYDLNPADLKRQHPIKISLLNLPAPNYCQVPADLLPVPNAPQQQNAQEVQDHSDNLVASEEIAEVAAVELQEYLANDEQTEFLAEIAQNELPRLPLDCWMDELLWQFSDIVGPGGKAEAYLDPSLAGKAVADFSALSLQHVVEYAKPIVPIIAQPSQPPAPQQVAVPPQPVHNELALAASAIIGVADDLEAIAGALRNWGASINRVAAGQPALLR